MKIEYISPAVHHSRGVNLTYEEYQEVFKNFWKTNFLPSTAYDISYELIYDDFFGEYGFALNYHLPLSESIEEVFNRDDSFTEIISVDTTDSDKIIRREQYLK